MADGFAELIDRSNDFFEKLTADNTKAFYEANKAFYTTEIKKPAELMADLLADDIHRLTGTAVKPKVFRIHRDVRFSKDKTPYNPHLHLMWSSTSETAPAIFFGSSPDYLIVGVGIMGLKGDSLTRYRALVDRYGAELETAILEASDKLGAVISDWGPEPLKRVPKPYDPEHPQAELLKRKALAVTAPPRADWREAGLIPAITATLDDLLPVWRILNRLA